MIEVAGIPANPQFQGFIIGIAPIEPCHCPTKFTAAAFQSCDNES
jgi:hypothetical protein